jgi:hypothetical protein
VKIVANLKGALRLWFLKRAMYKPDRLKKFLGYSQANTFGIIYDATTEENYRRITMLVKELQQDRKKVKTMGFVNMKKLPAHAFPKLTFEFCSQKDFSITQQPILPAINEFAKQSFDILIDLTPSDFHQMKYLSAISDSVMKVGRYDERYKDIYDLMLQVDDTNTIEETIDQVLLYLKMINNGTTN